MTPHTVRKTALPLNAIILALKTALSKTWTEQRRALLFDGLEGGGAVGPQEAPGKAGPDPPARRAGGGGQYLQLLRELPKRRQYLRLNRHNHLALHGTPP